MPAFPLFLKDRLKVVINDANTSHICRSKNGFCDVLYMWHTTNKLCLKRSAPLAIFLIATFPIYLSETKHRETKASLCWNTPQREELNPCCVHTCAERHEVLTRWCRFILNSLLLIKNYTCVHQFHNAHSSPFKKTHAYKNTCMHTHVDILNIFSFPAVPW